MSKKYFELVFADHKDIAKNCGCEVGQWVGRVYLKSGGSPVELIGDEDQVRSFVDEQMKDSE